MFHSTRLKPEPLEFFNYSQEIQVFNLLMYYFWIHILVCDNIISFSVMVFYSGTMERYIRRVPEVHFTL